MQTQEQSYSEVGCFAEASSLTVAVAAYPKILQWSVGKIADSRRRRTGIDLRRNLLIANVIFKARSGILQFRARQLLEERSRMPSATSDTSATASETSAETSNDSEATSDAYKATSDNSELTSDITKVTSDITKVTSDVSEATSEITKVTSDFSEATSDPFATFGTTAPVSNTTLASDIPVRSSDPCATTSDTSLVPAAPRKRRSSNCQQISLPQAATSDHQQQSTAADNATSPHSPPKRAMMDEPEPENAQEYSEEQHLHQHQHQHQQQLLVLQSSFLDLSVGSQASQAQPHIPCLICSS